MNLVLPALILLLLLLPGAIFLYAYSRGFWIWNSPVTFSSYIDQIAPSIVIALFLHSIWASFLSLFGITFDWASVLRLLLNSYGKDNQYFDVTIKAVTDQPISVILYLLSLYMLAVILGYSGHWLVRRTKLDRKSKFFRFRNEWYYLLSGEVMEFGELGGRPPQIDGVYLSAVVQHNDADYLYRGIVTDFSYSKEGQLDRVILTLAHRRLLKEDRSPENARSLSPHYEDDERYYTIEGHYFILYRSEMETINLEYVTIAKEEQE